MSKTMAVFLFVNEVGGGGSSSRASPRVQSWPSTEHFDDRVVVVAPWPKHPDKVEIKIGGGTGG